MADSELYLIAHKVRGEPAFDIATQIECAECHGDPAPEGELISTECTECDGLGYWWIIPTSGHRAYPYSTMGLFNGIPTDVWRDEIGEIPPNLPDHYQSRAAPVTERVDALLALLGPAPKGPPMRRRI